VQSQLFTFHLGPNAALHLHDSKEARLAALFQGRDRLGQGLVRVEVKNWDPLGRRAVHGTFPLFDCEKALWHGSKLRSAETWFR
jgi:hypothetical protein